MNRYLTHEQRAMINVERESLVRFSQYKTSSECRSFVTLQWTCNAHQSRGQLTRRSSATFIIGIQFVCYCKIPIIWGRDGLLVVELVDVLLLEGKFRKLLLHFPQELYIYIKYEFKN